MSKIFKTITFPNNSSGQNQKIQTLKNYSQSGWEVKSETITQGQFKGFKACCLASLCLPFGFCAGQTDGQINVTLEKEE